jgi:hypothetical protein
LISAKKRLKYQALLKNHKDRLGITAKEQELNKHNSKSCNIEKFKAYMSAKLETNKDFVKPMIYPGYDIFTVFSNNKF